MNKSRHTHPASNLNNIASYICQLLLIKFFKGKIILRMTERKFDRFKGDDCIVNRKGENLQKWN